VIEKTHSASGMQESGETGTPESPSGESLVMISYVYSTQ
jgi:hypothetical protein